MLESILGFEKWTFILSIFEMGKYFPVKNNQKMGLEHNALI